MSSTLNTPHDDQTKKEMLIGTADGRRHSNVSWGSIFAGVVTFLALTIVLNLATAALGLSGADSTVAGIWTIISLAIALAAAGYVAGALAVRSGLLHGFLTWATSMLAILFLAGWLGGTLVGTVGDIAGSLASQVDVSPEQVGDAVDIDEEQAQQTAEDAADAASAGAWWAFGGSLIGGAIATGAGVLGARSVTRRREADAVRVDRA